MSILIKNVIVITLSPRKDILRNCQILIEGERIKAVGQNVEQQHDGSFDHVIDGTGCMVMPGFVNLHTHTSTSALRGREDDVLFTGLRDVYQKFYQAVTPEESYWFSRLAIFEMIRSGITAYIDCSADMESAARAAAGSGVRAFVTTGRLFDRGVDGVSANLDTAENFIQKWHGADEDRIHCMLYPYSPDACSPDLLKEVARMAKKLGVRVTSHVAAKKEEAAYIRENYNTCLAEYLDGAGLLGKSFVGADGYFLEEEDMRILSFTRSNMAVNPAMGAKLGLLPPTNAILENGIVAGLGTDGLSWDMVKTMRHALTSWRIREHTPDHPQPSLIIDMATLNGYKALGMAQDYGCVMEGKAADIILVDCSKPDIRPVYKDKFTSNLVHTGMSNDVVSMIVGGKLVMEDRRIVTFDEREVLSRAKEAAVSVLARL